MKNTPRATRRRKANARERKFLPKDCTVEEVDLEDPNLAPHHRDNFIAAIRGEVTGLDELIGRWYRHRGECGDPDCDCGGNELIAQAETLCGHLLAAKELFGVILITDYPFFARLVKEFGRDAHAVLSAEEART
jgi:hypothetical protein